jgi:hypothetical protein
MDKMTSAVLRIEVENAEFQIAKFCSIQISLLVFLSSIFSVKETSYPQKEKDQISWKDIHRYPINADVLLSHAFHCHPRIGHPVFESLSVIVFFDPSEN